MGTLDKIPLWLRRIYFFNVTFRDEWVVKQAAEINSGARILDIGAGSCPYRDLFSHCDYETQDFACLEGEQLRYGSYGEIDYRCDAEAIPVSDGRYDAILCTEVLEHLPHPIKVVNEMARIIKPGGRLLLTAPLGSGIHQEPFHFYGGYTPYWYLQFLSEAGFVDIQVESNGGFYRYYAQESLRFLQMTRPFAKGIPSWHGLLWAPFWLLLAPLLGIVLPVICAGLDRYDLERRFTVGYHVRATRSGATDL